MTIHRTRVGSEPSGGAEPGRKIILIGKIFVEYSGDVPTQLDLDAIQARHAADKLSRKNNKDVAIAHMDNKPVTWGDLRPILIDDGIL